MVSMEYQQQLEIYKNKFMPMLKGKPRLSLFLECIIEQNISNGIDVVKETVIESYNNKLRKYKKQKKHANDPYKHLQPLNDTNYRTSYFIVKQMMNSFNERPGNTTLNIWFWDKGDESAHPILRTSPENNNAVLEDATTNSVKRNNEDISPMFGHAPLPKDFESLASLFREIDIHLLPIIRSISIHRERGRKYGIDAHAGLLRDQFHLKGYDYEKVMRRLHNTNARNSIKRTMPEINLQVKIDKDFQHLEYIVNEDKSIFVKNPLLVWNCPCRTIPHDEENINKNIDARCMIHSSEHGIEIRSRFIKGWVIFYYDNMKFLWRNGIDLWPPSVDSFFMMMDMQKDGAFSKKYERVLDLGPGTGFLGISLARKNPHVTYLCLSDWLLSPLLFGLANWELNNNGREYVEVEGNVGLFINEIKWESKKFDLVICNPPYLPLIDGFADLGQEATVAGTDLLVDTIEKCASMECKIYIQFSSLARKEVEDVEKKIHIKLRPIGDEREIPFRVRIALDNKEYMEALKKIKYPIIVKENDPYKYWHKVRTYILEK